MDSTQFNNRIIVLSDQLFRLAKSILQNEDAAWDAVQDLNLKLWEKRLKLKEVENIPAFAMRSMRNLCLDIIRQHKKVDEIANDIEYQELNPYQQTERNDMVKKIQLMIDRLPELQRTIIRMRDVEGMEISEISYITQITENAVSVNLSRARQKIRGQLINEHNRVEERIWRK
ncbi:RNA polymerase sigma factor FliA [bioreactor metagenome]|uniref:RNA polymerase sigma factor FliA n=1 Tax=bioreactor metagenome TaxID=1076179 RepID=A0A645GG86_9ZZZZ|nr:sigma-70 family RNA polymerase sigma factor [Paludibacter sp.]